MCGVSITNIDAKVIKRIRECSFGIVVPELIPKGLYRFQYSETTETLTLEKLPKGGGSHKDAWKEWENLVTRIKKHVDADIIEYADADLVLTTHLDFVVKTPKEHYNPPEIRGEINYQFTNSTWFFEGITDDRARLLNSKIRSIDYSFTSSDERVIKFTANNALIFRLAKDMFDHLVESYPRGAYQNIKNKHKHTLKSMMEIT
jgi:hypothetical protein